MEKNKKIILGITAFNHDSSACIIKDGRILAFCEEERFNHIKHTKNFPLRSIKFCLRKAKINVKNITDIAFYFNPLRCLINYIVHNNPFFFFIDPSIFKRKRFYYELIWLSNFIYKIISIKRILGNKKIKIHFIKHHLAHVWYGFFASNFQECTVLSNDSMGEDISSLAINFRKLPNGKIETKKIFSQRDPHSIGYLYGAVTQFLGYKRGAEEGKVMALAGFGNDNYIHFFDNAVEYLSDEIFHIKDDLLVRRSFKPKGQRLSDKFFQKFGNSRKRGENLTQLHYDIANALQITTEKIVFHQLKFIKDKNIVITGGVAQNSVLNGKITNLYPYKTIFIPPIPHDAGCSLGAAIHLFYKFNNKIPLYVDSSRLGPEFKDNEIIKILKKNKVPFRRIKNPLNFLALELSKNKVIAVSRGKMECGPRALGNRSIIASPIDPKMKDYLNLYIKYRESFRPYGGFILDREVKKLFDYKNKNITGPYMSFVYKVKKNWKEKIPSLVHVDGTSRIQILNEGQDNFLDHLLVMFNKICGVPILINTSLNLKGFPIARAPSDVLNTFYNSAIDHLLFNKNILVSK